MREVGGLKAPLQAVAASPSSLRGAPGAFCPSAPLETAGGLPEAPAAGCLPDLGRSSRLHQESAELEGLPRQAHKIIASASQKGKGMGSRDKGDFSEACFLKERCIPIQGSIGNSQSFSLPAC